VALSLTACGGSQSGDDSVFQPADPIDMPNGPLLFGQNLFTSAIPTRIVSTSGSGNIVTTQELSYSRSTRTLTLVSVTTSGETNVSGALEINYEFNDQGQVIADTRLSNGNLTQVANYEYIDNLLVRVEYRSTFNGEPELIRTLNYDGEGRFISGETINNVENEVSRTHSREYTDNGWVSTTNNGGAITRIVNELNDSGQVVSSQSTVTTGTGGLSRTTTQVFDENNLRTTRRRFNRGELQTETQYLDYVTIDRFIHDRIYQWDVFFGTSNF